MSSLTPSLIRLPNAMKTCALVAALALTPGCFTVNASLPGTLRNDVKPDQTEKVGALKIEKTNYFFLFGLVGAPKEDFFANEIKQQVQARGADGVANVKYEGRTGCVNLLISFFTCDIVTPRDYTLSGDIVRIKTAPLAGVPPSVAPAAVAAPGVKQVRRLDDGVAPEQVAAQTLAPSQEY